MKDGEGCQHRCENVEGQFIAVDSGSEYLEERLYLTGFQSCPRCYVSDAAGTECESDVLEDVSMMSW